MSNVTHTGRKQTARAGELFKLPERTIRALEVLRDAGQDGIDCFLFGQELWADRKGRISASGGGGDYAAQMMLGRLRKLGFARVNRGEGSSRWALTAKGALALNPWESPWTQSARKAQDRIRARKP